MIKINDNIMMAIVSYMDDEIREQINFRFAPCSNEKFLKEYCKVDTEFAGLLEEEFGIAGTEFDGFLVEEFNNVVEDV